MNQEDFSEGKKKIIILGGGMSALTAAWELTNQKDWQKHYDITLYQLGWRLGGKTSTGRGPKNRIQEHGIHIFQGWYDNAFRLLKEVYDERRTLNLAPKNPCQHWEDVFEQNNSTFLTSYSTQTNKWINWPMIFPKNTKKPGIGPLPFWMLLVKLLALAMEFALGSPFQKTKGKEKLRTWIVRKLFFNNIDPTYDDSPEAYNPKDEGKTPVAFSGTWERIGIMLKLTFVIFKGVFKDVFSFKTFQFDYSKINHLDFREWLKKHGASEELLESVVVRFAYTGTFANIGTGDLKDGAISAGIALQFFVQSMGYKGSFVWQFKAGTGESMITPIYEVLKHRGVKFKFFHKVEKIHYSPTLDIEKITISEQVKLKGGEYNPVFEVNGMNAWPAEPLYDQLDEEEVQKLKQGHINLESPWANWQNHKTFDLEKGSGFDQIILGIPIGVLPSICGEIIENKPAWKSMVDNVKTIPTQAVQLWLKPTLKELGLHLSQWGMAHHFCQPNVVTYADSMYSWLDSTLVLNQESWDADNKPGMIAYYTGSWKATLAPFSDHTYQDKENARLQSDFRDWLSEKMGFFWSDAAPADNPDGLDLNLLVAPDKTITDQDEKYNTQFFRANVSPTDHYTLSLPNTDQYRLKTDQSGFNNLFLTGDWINFGLNVGYIEGTIISGYQAAQAVLKQHNLTGRTKIY